jgi:hypothetical protein
MATRYLQSVVVDTDTVILPITDHFHTDSQSNTFTIESIQFQLDSNIKDLSAEWMASIPFSCTVIHKMNPFVESYPPIPSIIDICDYLAGQKYPASRLSFCSITYPLPMLYNELSLDKSTGWRDLSRDLAKAAHIAGNFIMLNGSQKSNEEMNHNRVFRCASMKLTDKF